MNRKPAKYSVKSLIVLLFSMVLILVNCASTKNVIKAKTIETRVHNLKSNNYCSIQEVIKEFSDVGNVGIVSMPDGSKREILFNLTRDNYGYFNIAKYVGTIRKMDSMKINVINNMFKENGLHEMSGKYHKEVEVEIDSFKFWLPIQDTLLGYWNDEVKSGENVLIYFRVWGALNLPQDSKWLFLIHKFNGNVNDGLWDEAMDKFNSDDWIMGEEIMKKAIELNPNDGRNYAVLGYLYTNRGKALEDHRKDSLFSIAENYFKESTKKTPEYSYQYFQWAVLKFYKKDYSSSWALIEEAKTKGEKEIDDKLVTDLESKLPYKSYLKTKNVPEIRKLK